jgi:hypothetical protein
MGDMAEYYRDLADDDEDVSIYAPETSMATKKKRKDRPAGMRFEEALAHLRRGKHLRRRAWKEGVFIAKAGDRVFLFLGSSLTANRWSTPLAWRPYPECILSRDWEVVTN